MRWRLILAASGLAAAMLLGLSLYWRGHAAGVAAERPKLAAATARATVASLETQGARASAIAADEAAVRRETAQRMVTNLTPQILAMETADAPLDPHRAERLRAHDQQLCRLAPELDGCTAD